MANPIIAGIYKIEHIQSGKIYVGQSKNIQKRIAKHKTELRCKRHCNPKLQRAWDKYGEDAFVFDALEVVENMHGINDREQYWLDQLQAVESGFNICPIAQTVQGTKRSEESVRRTAAAHTGMKRSDETRQRIKEARAKQPPMTAEGRAKLSESLRNRPPVSEETRRKLSAANKGKKMPPVSDETRRKLSIAGAGKKRGPLPEETRRKISAANMGRVNPPVSEETRKKISLAKTGQKYGPHTEDAKKRISNSLKGKPKPPRTKEHAMKLSETHKRLWAERKHQQEKALHSDIMTHE